MVSYQNDVKFPHKKPATSSYCAEIFPEVLPELGRSVSHCLLGTPIGKHSAQGSRNTSYRSNPPDICFFMAKVETSNKIYSKHNIPESSFFQKTIRAHWWRRRVETFRFGTPATLVLPQTLRYLISTMQSVVFNTICRTIGISAYYSKLSSLSWKI